MSALAQRGSVVLPSEQDRIDAANYWRDKEWKKFAVDVVAGPDRKPTYRRTFYAGARSHERAIACVQREAIGLPSRARFIARLAGPRELGCVPTQGAQA